MWGWETLLIPTPGFWYFQGFLAQWSSFWLMTHWTLHKPSTGFLAENLQLPTWENGGNLGLCSLFCSYNLGLTINSNVSPEFNSIIKIYSLGLNKAPWALEAHLSCTQIEAANSQTSIRVHLLCLLPLDTREKHLSPSNTTWRKKHSSVTGSLTYYAKTVGGGEKTERNGCRVSGMDGESDDPI